MVWLFVGERITVDANLKYCQLPCLERDLNSSDDIFISGYNFF